MYTLHSNNPKISACESCWHACNTQCMWLVFRHMHFVFICVQFWLTMCSVVCEFLCHRALCIVRVNMRSSVSMPTFYFHFYCIGVQHQRCSGIMNPMERSKSKSKPLECGNEILNECVKQNSRNKIAFLKIAQWSTHCTHNGRQTARKFTQKRKTLDEKRWKKKTGNFSLLDIR